MLFNTFSQRLPLLGFCLIINVALIAETVAYWRFEGDQSGPPAPNSLLAYTAGRTTGMLLGGTTAIDVSGNGNTLYGWDDFLRFARYSEIVPSDTVGASGPANAFSLSTLGSQPRAFTWSTQSQPSGTDVDTLHPLAWTIESSVYLSGTAASGWRTFLGRDGYGVAGDANSACLYFQKTAGGVLRIHFVDVAGNSWEASDTEQFLADRWYHVAAVSDGATLRLYKWDLVEDAYYRLVGSADISSSPDPRLKGDTVTSSSLPLDKAGDPMNWSIGSGMFASGGRPESGLTDFWVGFIDEVRISDHARSPNELLFSEPIELTEVTIEDQDGEPHFRMGWNSRNGIAYRVVKTPDPSDQTWTLAEARIAASPPANSWADPDPVTSNAFYQVEIDDSGTPLEFSLLPGEELNPIDEKIYGHFLEHIYRSVNGGLWGDLIWNRSFELWSPALGLWTREGSEIVQSSPQSGTFLYYGDNSWTDYEYSLEALKTGGNEGFLIPFRANGGSLYWLNLGGWGNTSHRLEKGQGNPVGPAVAGSIATDFWYAIRIRCEGNRIQVWLDDSLIIDWTDTITPILNGRVGIGTWNTQARFRNFSVQDLAGGTLYSSVPPIYIEGNPWEWTAIGDPVVAATTDARNSHYAVRLEPLGVGEFGLTHGPVKVIEQDYIGSVWAKSEGSHELVVRLRDGNSVLAEAALGATSGTWAKYPFSFTPTAGAGNATIEVAATGTGILLLDQVSLMGADALANGGFRPDLLQAAIDLKPPVIRWPGGCYASAYNWKDGIGSQDNRRVHPFYQWDDRDVNSLGTDEFMKLCKLVGAEPIMVLNLGVAYPCAGYESSTPFPRPEAELLQDALDWIEYCNGSVDTEWGAVRAANGHPEPYNVKYWEIDNETWSMGSVWYVNKVNEVAPLLRQADPTIELLACGSNLYDQTWNEDVIYGAGTNIDYISVHSYFEPETFASTPPAYEAYLEDLADMIAASDNPSMKIYNSEWNVQSIDLRTGLFAGGILNVFERQGETFKIGGPALMFRHQKGTWWNNAFVNFDHSGLFYAPNYIVMKLWRDHYAPTRIGLEGDPDSLNLIATKSEDGKTLYVKVINPDASARWTRYTVPDGYSIAGANLQYVTAPALTTQNSLANPDAVRVEAGEAIVSGSSVEALLPAYSASVIEIGLE